MKFLRHLLGIAKLDKEKNHCIREKTGTQKEGRKEGSKESNGNKTVPEKVATARTEDGHKTEYQNKHYNIDQKDKGT
jgi:hypothetical protein